MQSSKHPAATSEQVEGTQYGNCIKIESLQRQANPQVQAFNGHL